MGTVHDTSTTRPRHTPPSGASPTFAAGSATPRPPSRGGRTPSSRRASSSPPSTSSAAASPSGAAAARAVRRSAAARGGEAAQAAAPATVATAARGTAARRRHGSSSTIRCRRTHTHARTHARTHAHTQTLDVESRGPSLALAPPPRVCVEKCSFPYLSGAVLGARPVQRGSGLRRRGGLFRRLTGGGRAHLARIGEITARQQVREIKRQFSFRGFATSIEIRYKTT